MFSLEENPTRVQGMLNAQKLRKSLKFSAIKATYLLHFFLWVFSMTF
jgi:hypothetical protein